MPTPGMAYEYHSITKDAFVEIIQHTDKIGSLKSHLAYEHYQEWIFRQTGVLNTHDPIVEDGDIHESDRSSTY